MTGGSLAVEERAPAGQRRRRTMAKGWVHAVVLVGIFGFTVPG